MTVTKKRERGVEPNLGKKMAEPNLGKKKHTAPERFEILGGSRDLLVVLGASRCWRVERPQNSGRKWLPSRCLRCVGTLTRGASSKFWAQVATLSLFLTRRDAGAWSVFEIQGVSGHPLVVFGAS